MKKFKNFLIFCIVFTLNTSYAENWVAIDDKEIYVDIDSKEIKGELTTVTLKVNSGFSEIEIDCKKMKYRLPRRKFEDIQSGTFTENVHKIVCKRIWEIWK